MNNFIYYLACPYSSKDKFVLHRRVLEINRVGGEFLKQGKYFFSPISQNHPIKEVTNFDGGWEFWSQFDFAMLMRCNALVVVMLDEGWRTSVGVTAEIQKAKELGMPIYYLDPKTMEMRDNAPISISQS